MAKRIVLGVEIDSKAAKGSVGELQAALKALQSQQKNNTIIGSKDYHELGNQINNVKSKIQDATGSTNTWSKAFGSFPAKFNTIGNVIGGLILSAISKVSGAIKDLAIESIHAFREQEKADKELIYSLDNNVLAFERLKQAAGELQATSVFGDEMTEKAMKFLAAQGLTEEQIKKTTQAAADMVAAGVPGFTDLQSATEKLALTYEGSAGKMGKLDARIKDMTEDQLANGEAVDILAEKYKGFAENQLQTSEGRAKHFQNALGDLKEVGGGSLSSFVDDATVQLDKLITSFNDSIAEMTKYQNSLFDASIKRWVYYIRAGNDKEKAYAKEQLAKLLNDNAEIKKRYEETYADLYGLRKDHVEKKKKLSDLETEQEIEIEITRLKDIKKAQIIGSTAYLKYEKQILELESKLKKDSYKESESDLKARLKKEAMLRNKALGDIEKQAITHNELMIEIEAENTDLILEKRAETNKSELDLLNEKFMKGEMLLADYVEANKKAQDKMVADEKEAQDKRRAMVTDRIQYVRAATQALSDIISSQMEDELAEAGDNEEKKKAINKKYANARFIMQVSEIEINTALAVIKALAEIAYPYNIVVGALMSVAGTTQIANANNARQRMLKAKTGGFVGGNTHEFGGTAIEAEQGEFIVNKQAMSNPLIAESVIRGNAVGNKSMSGNDGLGQLTEKRIAEIAATVVSSIPVTNNTKDVELLNNKARATKQRAYLSM